MSLTRKSRVTDKELPGSQRRVVIESVPGKVCLTPSDATLTQPPIVVQESQVTDSENHPAWRRPRRRRYLGDLGGEFYSTRDWVRASGYLSGESLTNQSTTCRRRYQFSGCAYAESPKGGAGSFPTRTSSTSADLDKVGATAVSRVSPTNSIADLSVMIGELLHGGISRSEVAAWESRVDSARSAGKDYLALEFGWKPFVSDLYKFADGVSRLNQIMDQYVRDAGKVVRRRYEFPLETTTSLPSIVSTSTQPYIGGAFNFATEQIESLPGTRVAVVARQQRRWFSGAFTYHLPPIASGGKRGLGWYATTAQKVFGLELTPETVWNLAPWSWAVDWFSNAGDVLSNVSDWATDGLVMRYGYVMEHTIDTRTVSRTGFRLKNQQGSVSDVIYVRETKIRRKANPFGFGLTWEGLTPRQMAIAAALGISKSGS